MEEWKDIIGFENYQISNFGRVKNLKSGRILSNNVTTHGYARVTLYISSIRYTVLVHRLVATHFLDEPSDELKETARYTKYQKVIVNHKDGNKTNNHVDNLEWIDNSGNTKHAFEIGLKTGSDGESNGSSKLLDSQILEIRQKYKDENGRHGLITELANDYNMSKGTISKIISNKIWTHIK